LIGNRETIPASVLTRVSSGGLALADVPDTLAITSPLDVQATVGQPFVYTLETNAATTSYGASNLPPGLTIDIVPRAITGTATTAGTFRVPLNASNKFGNASATLVITVVAPPSGPRIISGTSATARTGRPFRLQVISSANNERVTVSASSLPAGLTIDPITGIISGTPTQDGSSAVVLKLTTPSATTTATLQITVSSDLALPVILSPSEASVVPNRPFLYTVNAPGMSDASDPTRYQFVGNLPQGLGWDPVAGTISGTPNGRSAAASQSIASSSADAVDPPPHGQPLSGGIITNVQLFAANSRGTATLPLIFYLAPAGVVNISTRLSIGTGDNVLIAGFIITGNAPKKLILRGMGPSLPIPGKLDDPTLDIFQGNQAIGSNDNWRSAQEQEIIATTIPPPDDREAAAVAILDAPASYTAIVRGKNGSTGTGVVELYDLGTASLSTSSQAQLANLSTRGLVQTGDNVLIGGFIVSGATTKVIVRGMGPSLTAAGVAGALQDPTLDLVDSNGVVVKSDDNWRTGGQEQQIIDTTVAPTDDREAAVVATLNPGAFTAVVRGKSNSTGIGVVEVYVLP
jgi:hypothetical protein